VREVGEGRGEERRGEGRRRGGRERKGGRGEKEWLTLM
jgi:hypothetical protein